MIVKCPLVFMFPRLGLFFNFVLMYQFSVARALAYVTVKEFITAAEYSSKIMDQL